MEQWQDRTSMLLGEETLARFAASKVMVVGLGGVGAYAAEMLCRAGVGNMVILDSDTVSVTNRNRQLIALESTIGKLKTEVVAQRLRDINPAINLTIIPEYIEESNLEEIFRMAGELDYVVDAIDTLAPKISLIKYCVEHKIPHVSAMGAGAKLDATKIRIADISKSYNCPLAYILRKKLRKEGISKGFKVVFSEELPDRDAIVPMEERNKQSPCNLNILLKIKPPEPYPLERIELIIAGIHYCLYPPDNFITFIGQPHLAGTVLQGRVLSKGALLVSIQRRNILRTILIQPVLELAECFQLPLPLNFLYRNLHIKSGYSVFPMRYSIAACAHTHPNTAGR